jgi:hypothetical protein
MKPFFTLITLLVVAMLVPGAVAAQENATNATDATDDLPDDRLDDCTEHIDNVTTLCSAEYENGRITLELHSDRPQRVTLTDAGGMMEGGEITQQTSHLSEGRNTVHISVTQHNGFAGVTVNTGRTLYAVPVEQDSSLIGPPWTAQDVQLSALAGAVVTALLTLYLTWRTLTGRSTEPERIA